MEIDRETILLMSKGDKKAYETTKKFFPKSVKMFEEIIEKYGKQ